MKKSDELKKRADQLERELAAKQEEYTNLIADGKSTGKLAAEITEMESELAGTRSAVKVLQDRETKETEKERLAYAEKMTKQVEAMRTMSEKQRDGAVSAFIEALEKLGELSQTARSANSLIQQYTLNSKTIDASKNLSDPIVKAAREITHIFEHAAAYGGDQVIVNRFRNALERI